MVQQEAIKMISKKYSYTDIIVSQTETKESIKKYGNNLSLLLGQVISEKRMKDDFQAMEFYLQTDNQDYLKTIQSDGEAVEQVIEKILLLPVPPSSAVYHLIVLNQMESYKDTLNNMAKAKDDPLRATIAFKRYPDEMVEVILLYKKLSEYFSLKKIVFTHSEQGYVFTIGYTLQ
jgi:hypothetical protein